ncbi:hypothetical protein [Weissella ceti]|uniref:hypothetical protein n=1 Tax=Weissella ceti TaxID=759620 RepID=UPI001BCFECF2|nr:hypothetical protein [Weissella ceti]QVK12617.1 hypothetical protein KHQ31_03055 [Weissella ceti]
MQMNKSKWWKVISIGALLTVGGLFIWQAQQVQKLGEIKLEYAVNKQQIDHERAKLNQISETELINYKHDYVTKSADKVIDTFFKQVRTYDSSASYNARKERVVKADVATNKVIDSKLFKTDRQLTGENYVDNTGITVQYTKARFYVQADYNGQLSGQVMVDSVLRNTDYEHESTAIYNVTYDKELGKLTDVQYMYGLLKGDQ